MENVKMIQFNPHRSESFLDELVECYRIVFGESPWYEWKKCSVCNQKWGIDEVYNHEHCGGDIIDFWPKDVVKNDLFSEITLETACRLVIDQSNGNFSVAGFCWAYPIDIDCLEHKLKLPGVSDLLRNKFGVERVGYLDEIGLIKRIRGKHIAKALYSVVMRDIFNKNIKIGVMRTKTIPPTIAFHWFVKDGYQIIAKYNDFDGRVILAKELNYDK